jgi:DNA-directed RNA polymerase specialized sigma24 family protein
MSPELALRSSELSTFHRRTLRRLPRRCRRACVMVREERTSYKLVAQRLGVSRNVVCAHVVTAQRQFRVGLLEEGIPVPPAVRSRARRRGAQ